MVHDAVDDGGDGRIQDDLGAVGERQIRRDDEAPAIVAATDEAGKQVGADRKSRATLPALRWALAARDRHRRFPGCQARRCDALRPALGV